MRDPVFRTRSGFSLLELLLAASVLAMALIPVTDSFHTLIFGYRKSFEATHAAFLAQSIMEGIRYRLYNRDSRFYTLNQSEATKQDLVASHAYERFFRDLGEAEGAKVVSESSSRTSTYFLEFQNLQGTTLHGITQATSPELFRTLANYSCSVAIKFDSPGNLLDSDGDGQRELDMADVCVTLRWKDAKDVDRSFEFWTVLTRHQYETCQAPAGGGP